MNLQKNQLLIETEYSFYNSTITFQECIDFAAQNKHTHVFLTEDQHIKFFVQFYGLAVQNDLIPVSGIIVFWDDSQLLLIAKNTQGYRNLLKISSGQKKTEDLLSDIVVILLDGDIEFTNTKDFYIANSSCPKGVYIRRNTFYKKEDFEKMCLLRSIKNNNTLEDIKQMISDQQNNFLIQEDDLMFFWSKNLDKIINSIEIYDLSSQQNFLNFMSESEAEQKIKNIIYQNPKLKQFENSDLQKTYEERIARELTVITQNQYSNYFLVVVDFINHLKSQHVLTGVGRGSVCGSLIAYLLNITEIDPIKYGLYFERFMNSQRNELPDIDVDIDSSKREMLIQYLCQKYGEQHIALISTLQMYKSKNSIKDCMAPLEIDSQKLAQIIKWSTTKSWEKEILKNQFLLDKEIENLISKSEQLINVPRGITVSPSGIIISSADLTHYLPTYSSHNNIKTTYFTLSQIEQLGFIKFDILSLVILEMMGKIINKISLPIHINLIDWNDPEVYHELTSKNVSGIFQVEGASTTSLLSGYKPKNIVDLANCISLVRPGSFEYIDQFLHNKNNPKQIKYLIPEIESILKCTHGIPIYQEQIMEIVSTITGCSFEDADTYRKAISKKNKDLLENLKTNFFEKGIQKYTFEQLKQVWEYIYKFGSFGFNKSHAIAYAKITYQTAWLKTKFPNEFYSTLLSDVGFKEKYLTEIQKKGFVIKFPSFNLNEANNTNPKHIYLNHHKLPYKYLELWNKADKIMSTDINLTENIMSLIKSEFSPSDILALNESGYFDFIFQENESNDWVFENINVFFENFLLWSNQNKTLENNFKKPTKKQNWKKIKEKIYGINS